MKSEMDLWSPYSRPPKGLGRERENVMWSKIKAINTWVPQVWSKFTKVAQCFKYVGTLIPRYTIIKYDFLTLGKIIYQK